VWKVFKLLRTAPSAGSCGQDSAVSRFLWSGQRRQQVLVVRTAPSAGSCGYGTSATPSITRKISAPAKRLPSSQKDSTVRLFFISDLA